MIDSIVLNFNIVIPLIETYEEWEPVTRGRNCQIPECYEYTGHGYPTETIPTRITAEYYPNSRYTRSPLLKIYIGSVQKLIFGNNYQNCTDINLIIKKVNEHINKIPGLSSIDASEGLLRRIDICKNHHVGEFLQKYIELINTLDYDHRNKSCYSNKRHKPFNIDFLDNAGRFNGVVFSSHCISTSFYDKEKECNDPKARGILRHEVRIIRKKEIARQTGLSDPKLKDLTLSIAEKILKKDLARLGLDREILSEESAREQLIKIHGNKKGSKLYDYLRIFNDYPGKTKKQIAESRGVSYDTVLNWSSALKKAGVLPSLAPRSIKLPQLTPWLDKNDGKISIKVLGDTRNDDEGGNYAKYGNRQPGDLLARFTPRGIGGYQQTKRGDLSRAMRHKSSP